MQSILFIRFINRYISRFIIRRISEQGSSVVTSIIQIALSIAASPLDVCAVIAYETHGTFSTSIRSPIGAVGLIQFTEDTAESLGTTTDKLSIMSFKQQSKYVIKYFKQRKVKMHYDGNDLKRMYSAIFCGNTNYKRCSKLSDGYNNWDEAIREVGNYRKKCKKLLKSS